MRRAPASILNLSLLLGAAACGHLMINGKPAGGGGGDDASVATGDGGANPGSGGDAASATAAAYASWSYQSCGPSEWCGIKLAGAAGIQPDGQRNGDLTNPRAGMTNPDPEWLPGWDSLSSDDDGARDFFEALNLAASNRTWWAACRQRYAAVKVGLDARMAEVPALVAAAQGTADPYERLDALLRLTTRSTGAPTQDGEFAAGFDAAAYETERAIVGGFAQAKKLWVFTAEQHALPEASRELLAPRWDAALEERAFCMHAAQHGSGDLPALTPPDETYAARVKDLVKPVFTDADRAEYKRQREERLGIARTALSLDDPSAPASPQQMSNTADELVTSFAVKGTVATIKIFRRSEYGSSIGEVCIGDRGIRSCPVMNVKKTVTKIITFPDWPAGLTVAKGDSLYFYGETTSSNIKGQGTPKETWNEAIRGLHLITLTRPDGQKHEYWKRDPR